MTASAPTGQSDIALALVRQGLQPIMFKRQRFNPSRLVKNFRQGVCQGCGTFWTGVGLLVDAAGAHAAPEALSGPGGRLLAPCMRPEPAQNPS